MLCKILYILLIVKWSQAHYNYMPDNLIARDDSDIVVDTNDKKLTKPLRLMPQYPMYQIISAGKPQQSTTSSTPKPTASTTTSDFFKDEFPRDLLEIAQQKLGLKSLDEIPSISELADLLGTSNTDETIKYMRQLTSTEQGIALIKTFIESADYTDNTANRSKVNDQFVDDDDDEDVEDNDNDNSNGSDDSEKDGDDGAIDVTTEKPAKPKSLLERIGSYFNLYNLWPQQKPQKALPTRIDTANRFRRPIIPYGDMRSPQPYDQANPEFRPLLVRNPLPYHYPIPMRPDMIAAAAAARAAAAAHAKRMAAANGDAKTQPPPAVVHMNTPKVLLPSLHMHLAKMSKVPPKKLEQFLQSKPKLAELAAKVANFPVAHERPDLFNAQLMAAVQKAVEQDEDLKKLLNSRETLK